MAEKMAPSLHPHTRQYPGGMSVRLAGIVAKAETVGAQRQIAAAVAGGVAPVDAAAQQMARTKNTHGDHCDAVNCLGPDYSNRMAKLTVAQPLIENSIPPLSLMSMIEMLCTVYMSVMSPYIWIWSYVVSLSPVLKKPRVVFKPAMDQKVPSRGMRCLPASCRVRRVPTYVVMCLGLGAKDETHERRSRSITRIVVGMKEGRLLVNNALLDKVSRKEEKNKIMYGTSGRQVTMPVT